MSTTEGELLSNAFHPCLHLISTSTFSLRKYTIHNFIQLLACELMLLYSCASFAQR